jgi:hypothetical protein
MNNYIIKFSNGRYMAIINDKRFMVKEAERAFTYSTKDLAESTLKFMKKHHSKMQDCVVVDKSEEMKLHKIAE